MRLQNHEHHGVITDAGIPPQTDDHNRGRRILVNWVLALLTVPAAALVMVFAIGAAMSMAACSGAQCPDLGPNGLVYGVLLYGAPVVAASTLIASFFTAARRRGFVVPLCALALLFVDIAATAILLSS
ncbi:hypothetical protein PJK45_18270 [Mycobacterium kansasii]|nr:hypothetical protein [Mycobacterium kansasii]EUA09100.1 putative membrane protein [Mycobacterium kansasii 662]KEP41452.1 hypothetical protein MKSMC1_33770 [Mycobacterium kansasii]MXO36530.1 hypothetical protein [Mycobacterium kansasii]OOK64309.1 putative membrane protein [Mycobacterium kansasii]OOK73765.1 putative membrane protein [Mycobacterium kansasii]